MRTHGAVMVWGVLTLAAGIGALAGVIVTTLVCLVL